MLGKNLHVSHFFLHVYGKQTYEVPCTWWVEFLKFKTSVLFAYIVEQFCHNVQHAFPRVRLFNLQQWKG
jgi:hypothetical protein